MPAFDQSPSDDTPAEPSNSHGLEVTACWERPIVPTAGGTTTLLVRVRTLADSRSGGRRAPVDVAFVLDRSGSMGGRPLDLVKQAVDVAVGHLGEEDRTALVVYDHAVETLQRLEPATPRVKTALRLALHGLDARGSTDLAGGWLAGCGQLSAGMEDAPDAGAPARGPNRRALRLPASQSRTAKRQVVRSLQARLRNQYSVSVAETDFQEKWQVAELLVTYAASDSGQAQSVLSKVVDYTEGFHLPVEIIEAYTELIDF